MKWNNATRVAFMGTVFVLVIGLSFLASLIAGEVVSYNWRSIQDFNRWKEWNTAAYIICSVTLFVPFAIAMSYFRSGIGAYSKRKKKRFSITIITSVMLAVAGIAECFICASANNIIREAVYYPHFTFLLVPVFLILLLFLCLVVKDNYGLFNW